MPNYVLIALALVAGFVFLRGSYRVGPDGKRNSMFAQSLRTGIVIGVVISILLVIGFFVLGL